MKYTDHSEYIMKLHDMLPEGHVARAYCTRAAYDCYCLNKVRESCVYRIKEECLNKEYCEQRAQIDKIVQLMDDTVDDVRNLVKKDFFIKFIDQDDKYVLDVNAGRHLATDFILYVYNPYEDAHEIALAFDYDDVPVRKEYVQGYALIDEYLKSKLGFVPDYEVM